MKNKELIDYLRENPTSEIMCRAADVIENQGRTISEHARATPSASEISDVIREITGCPDIKRGDESLLVKLLSLFHRSQGAQPPVSQPTDKDMAGILREALCALEGSADARSHNVSLIADIKTALAQQASGQDAQDPLQPAANWLVNALRPARVGYRTSSAPT